MTPESDFSSEEMEVLTEIFLTSSSEYLAVAREVLGAWSDEGIDEGQLKLLHRSVHSIKGAALQIGYLPIGTLAKALEQLVLAALAGAPAGAEQRRAMERGCDGLRDGLEALRAREALPAPDPALLDELARMAGGASISPAAGLRAAGG